MDGTLLVAQAGRRRRRAHVHIRAENIPCRRGVRVPPSNERAEERAPLAAHLELGGGRRRDARAARCCRNRDRATPGFLGGSGGGGSGGGALHRRCVLLGAALLVCARARPLFEICARARPLCGSPLSSGSPLSRFRLRARARLRLRLQSRLRLRAGLRLCVCLRSLKRTRRASRVSAAVLRGAVALSLCFSLHRAIVGERRFNPCRRSHVFARLLLGLQSSSGKYVRGSASQIVSSFA